MRGVGGLLAVPSSLSSCLPVARHLDPRSSLLGSAEALCVCGWGLERRHNYVCFFYQESHTPHDVPRWQKGAGGVPNRG
jgi:hypothetical protein